MYVCMYVCMYNMSACAYSDLAAIANFSYYPFVRFLSNPRDSEYFAITRHLKILFRSSSVIPSYRSHFLIHKLNQTARQELSKSIFG